MGDVWSCILLFPGFCLVWSRTRLDFSVEYPRAFKGVEMSLLGGYYGRSAV